MNLDAVQMKEEYQTILMIKRCKANSMLNKPNGHLVAIISEATSKKI